MITKQQLIELGFYEDAPNLYYYKTENGWLTVDLIESEIGGMPEFFHHKYLDFEEWEFKFNIENIQKLVQVDKILRTLEF